MCLLLTLLSCTPTEQQKALSIALTQTEVTRHDNPKHEPGWRCFLIAVFSAGKKFGADSPSRAESQLLPSIGLLSAHPYAAVAPLYCGDDRSILARHGQSS